MRTFVIADSSKRKAKPVGILTWRPGPGDGQGVFSLELRSDCDEEHVPLSLAFCARREQKRATPEESEEWARSRVVPESRHNIADVLKANGLVEYDVVSLLAACNGRSSDDDLLVYEVDVPPGLLRAQPGGEPRESESDREDSPQAQPGGEPHRAESCEAKGPQAQSMADCVIAAIRRQRAGSKVTYTFVDLGEGPADARKTASCIANTRAAGRPLTAAQRVGSLIRSERLRQDFTQKQLAARAGITQTVLSRTESGTGNPTVALLEEIAAGLGMQLDISLR